MARIQRTDEATNDLLDLWIHLKTTKSEAKATAFLRTLERKLRLLAGQPEMGKLRPEYRAGLRSFPVAPYLILYLPEPDGILGIRPQLDKKQR
jgi:toxin ParE1/3/4